MKRTCALVLALAALASAAAVPAEAAKKWIAGRSEQSLVVNCTSLTLGAPREEVGVFANAEFRADKSRLPRIGQAFYVRTQPGAVGRPCVDPSVVVEVILPPGVKTAISRKRPIRCFYIDIQSDRATRVPSSQGCPKKTGNGRYGRSINRTGSQGPAWLLPYGKAISLEVPLRSSRKLNGIGAPNCSRKAGEPPCFPRDVGPNVEFGVHSLDGNANPWLSPHAPLFVRR